VPLIGRLRRVSLRIVTERRVDWRLGSRSESADSCSMTSFASIARDGDPPAPKISVIVVVGTRPEAIKLIPIIVGLHRSAAFKPVVVSTGQHDLMVREVFKLAGIWGDATLWVGDNHANLNTRVSSVMTRFDDFCREWFHGVRPDDVTEDDVRSGRFPAAVLVHGDTSSALGAALAGFHLHIPIVHVEAGLRAGTGTLTPFPEELNRRLIARMACLHLAPTISNQENLVRENVPLEQVYVTGNTAIDALRWASGLEIPFADPAVQAVHDGDRRIVLVTAHRRENWGDGLRGIAEGVARLAAQDRSTTFVVPLHPNPRVRTALRPALEPLENVLLTEPMAYGEFARLLARCALVITDSGGIQEEAPALGKPVLVTREATERGEGIEAGTLQLVGTDPERIVAAAKRLLTDPAAYAAMANAANPYGDGRAAERIVAALEHLWARGAAPAPFGAGFDRRAVRHAVGLDGDQAIPLPRPQDAEPPRLREAS
jgi:UDP-N-acetylglucosamine 2-epimerase (non-hydrolysing)